MLALVLLVLIPLVANCVLRKNLHAFLVAALLGVVVLWARMVHLESKSADGDFDLFFAVGCVFWAGLQVLAYAVLFWLAGCVEKAVAKWTCDRGKANDGQLGRQ